MNYQSDVCQQNAVNEDSVYTLDKGIRMQVRGKYRCYDEQHNKAVCGLKTCGDGKARQAACSLHG